ncbi:MAG: hypothetical protein NTX52_02425 [Planctomycetota bacterium]|nr:hypothetical protein [Planctomycetota bacterium]
MKALSISQVCLTGAIILGLMVAWSTTAPQKISADTLIGGDVAGCRCTGTTAGGNCNVVVGCSGRVTTCDVGGSGPETCGSAGSHPCSGGGVCDNIADAKCTKS